MACLDDDFSEIEREDGRNDRQEAINNDLPLYNREDIKNYRKKLETRKFQDAVGDRFNIPEFFDPEFRMFCGLLKRTRRIDREMILLKFCEIYGPIPQEYQPYLRTLLKLKAKDKKGSIESLASKQISIFTEEGK